jgi:hypothetical protein
LIRVRGQKKQDFWRGLRLRALKSNDLKIKVFKYFNLPQAPAKNLAFLPPDSDSDFRPTPAANTLT